MATPLEVIASELLKSAIDAEKLFGKTKDQSYKDKAVRLRRIVANLQELTIGTSSVATLNDLTDVTISAPTNAQVLTYNSTTGQWENQTPAAGGGGDMMKSTYDVDNTGIVDNAEAISVIGRNSTGTTLYKGTVVYISGSTGNRPNFAKAQANAEATSAGTFGVVRADIANNSDGYVVCIGYIDNLDTRSTAPNPFTNVTLADGDTVYLHPTIAGYITNVKPSAPNHVVYVGKVTRTSPTNGTIVYRIQNGYELDELHDVAISSKANNDLLVYESATSLWKNKTFSAIFGGTPLVSVPTLDQVTTAGNTTTNAITVGGLTTNGNIVFSAYNRTIGSSSYPASAIYTGELYSVLNIRNSGNTNGLSFYDNGGTLQMRIWGTGNVSINSSTDAGYKLDVNGTARVQGQLTTTTANAQFGTIGASTGNFRIDGVNGAGYAFAVYSSNTLRFGVVGFGGIDMPYGFTVVSGSTDLTTTRLRIGTGNATAPLNIGAQSGNTDTIALYASNGTNQFNIKNATGNVLINTTTDAGFRLDVNGTARVQGQLTVGPSGSGTFLQTQNNSATWFSDINNPLRITSLGQSVINLNNFGDFTIFRAMSSARAVVSTSPEAFNTAAEAFITTGGLANRSLSNVNKSIFFASTKDGGSVQNAPLLRYFHAVKGNLTGYTSYRGIEIEDLDSFFGTTSGSVGIGANTSINASAILDVTSTTKGFLPPRMTNTQVNAIATPATGLQAYDSTNNKNVLYNGTSWLNVATESWVTAQGYLTSVTTPTLDAVTTAGSTTTNSITVGGVTSNGNIVIGGASSTGALRIYDGYYAYSFGSSTLGYNPNNNYTRVYMGASVTYTENFSGNYEWKSAGAIVFSLGNGDVNFFTSGAVVSKFKSSTGNFLIGTTTDSGYKLDVNGTGRLSNTLTISTSASDASPSNSILISTSSSGNGGRISWGDSNTCILRYSNSLYFREYTGNWVFESTGSNSILFAVRPATTTVSSGKFITNGTTTASSALAQGVYFNNTLVAAANNDVLVGLDINPTFTNGAFTGVQNVSLRVTSNTPIVRLDSSAVGSFHGIEFRNTGSIDAEIKQLPSSGEFRISNGRSVGWGGFITFYTDTVERVRIRNNGNVLIGTTTDAGYKLDVNGTFRAVGSGTGVYLGYNVDIQNLLTANALYIRSGSNISGGLYPYSTGTGGIQLQSDPSQPIIRGAYNSDTDIFPVRNDINNIGDVVIHGGGSERVRFKANGNVGIGTSSPTDKLHIVDNTNGNKFGRITAGGTDASAAWVAENNQGDNVVYRVFGSAVTGSQMGISLVRSASLMANLGGSGKFLVGTYSSTDFVMGTGNQERMRLVDSSGNFLIGTTVDSGYKLNVSGDIRSTSHVIADGNLKSNYQAGDEGGEINLNKPATGTTINTNITIDVYQNKLRIFESGGLNRGGYFDISALANGVGTNFSPAGYTGTLTIPGNPPGSQIVTIQNGIITNIA